MRPAVPDPDAPLGTYMLDGRLINQWVTLVEPVLYAGHLTTLASLCTAGVVTPLEATWWSSLDVRPFGVCAAAREREVAGGEWPLYSASFTRVADHAWVHEEVAPSAPAYRAVAQLLSATNFGFLLELGPSALLGTDTEPSAGSGYLAVPAAVTAVELLEQLVRAVGVTWAEVVDKGADRMAAVEVFVWGILTEIAERAGRLGVTGELAQEVLRRRAVLAPSAQERAEVHSELVARRPLSLAAELALCWWPDSNRYERTLDSGFDYVAHHADALRVGRG
ncbi:hypothetical protein [Streptomyces microflavus]|uniref:hypothetical protein n=1 Tax=Streptomyces microflavus TaxID=1919 RepID=UPI00380534A0